MNSKFIHLESNRATLNQNNCFDARFILNEPLKEIKRITLKSLEIPISFSNIRNSNNVLSFLFNGILNSITIPERNYGSMNDIIDILNNGLQPFNNTTLIFLINASNKVCIKITGNLPASFSIVETNLSRFILGFRIGLDIIDSSVVGTMSYIAINRYNLNCDNYLTILISNINYVNGHTNNSTFRIPFNAQMNQVFYYNEMNNYIQFISGIDKFQVISFLDIRIIDRFGVQLKSTIDYSMTVLVESDS